MESGAVIEVIYVLLRRGIWFETSKRNQKTSSNPKLLLWAGARLWFIL